MVISIVTDISGLTSKREEWGHFYMFFLFFHLFACLFDKRMFNCEISYNKRDSLMPFVAEKVPLLQKIVDEAAGELCDYILVLFFIHIAKTDAFRVRTNGTVREKRGTFFDRQHLIAVKITWRVLLKFLSSISRI